MGPRGIDRGERTGLAMTTMGRFGVRTIVAALGAAGLAVAGVPTWAGADVPVPQAAPAGTRVTVNGGAGDQTDPHISGNLVTYTDFSVSPSQIRYHDLATGTDVAIPSSDGGTDSLPAVSGAAVVYVHFKRDPVTHAIYYHDTAASAPPVELDPQANSNRRRVSIGATTVAWQDFGFTALSSPEIVAYDLSTHSATRLTDDALYDRDPMVDPSGTVITWAKCASLAGGCDIWDATLADGVWTVHQLTSDAAEESDPHTNGSVVTYASSRDSETADIRWQPVTGGPEQVLDFTGNDQNPHLSGNVITFEHYQDTDPTANFDIYAYDLSTGALYRLTESAEDESLNDVWSDASGAVHAVWSTRVATGDDNVYAFSFALPTATSTDTTAPTITITTPADTRRTP